MRQVETVYVNVASVLMARRACAGSHLLFLASFASNDTTMSQFHALTMLGESFPRSMTVCYWDLGVKPCGGRLGISKGETGAVRLP